MASVTEGGTGNYEQTFSTHIAVADNPDVFTGLLQIRVVVTDNVGNTYEETFETLAGISIKAYISTLLPEHTNTFKAGERGYIDIELNGYISELEISFEGEIEDVRTEEEKLEKLPTFSFPDEQREIRNDYDDSVSKMLSTTIDIENVEGGVQASENYRYYFDVPIYAEAKNGYTVYLHATNIYGNTADTTVTFNVTNNLLEDFRTTIRDNN